MSEINSGMDTVTNMDTTGMSNFFSNPRSDIPITAEFAPEYPYKILENLTNVINTQGIEFNNIIKFVNDQDWKDMYILYNNKNDNNNNNNNTNSLLFQNEIITFANTLNSDYNNAKDTIQSLGSRQESSKLTNLFLQKTNELVSFISNILDNNIDKEKIKQEKLSIINFLKLKIDKIYENNPASLYLYDLTINQYDTNDAFKKKIDIQLKYTELGVILMLKTELLHDLSPPVLDKETTGNLQNDLNKLLDPESPFIELLTYIDEKTGREKYITYTEEISTELILYISSLQGINRIYRQNDVDTVTRDNEKKLGSSILPAIFNNNNISITSDADNTAALIYSQISKNMKLENNTSKIYPFLDLDAGSAPSLHGFTESFVRQAQLERLKRANDNDENNNDSTTIPNIAGVNITIKDPSDRIMLTMENNNILNDRNYTINCRGFNTFTLNELSITNVAEKINNPPYSLNTTSTSQNSKKKKTNEQPSVLNIAIIKSIGDLIPYQVVSFFRALNPRSSEENLNELLNIISSRDYSMIFQIISNVRYFINQQDNTDNLNDKKIIVGCNLSNANAFFPFSKKMNTIFYYMSIIVNDQEYINLKNHIIKMVFMCFFSPKNISSNVINQDNNDSDNNQCYINNIPLDQFIILNKRYQDFLHNNDLCYIDDLITRIESDDKLNYIFDIDCLRSLNYKINTEVQQLYDKIDDNIPIDDDTSEYIIDNIDYCIATKLYNLVNNEKSQSTFVDNKMSVGEGGTKKNRKQPKKYKSYNRKSNRKSKSKKHSKSKNKRKPNKTLRKHR